jgi:PRTRC genetic system protein E
MTTNFFQNIVALQVAGDWAISIARDTADKLVVSVLFHNNNVGDDARKIIPPMTFNYTAQELDEGFFDAIAQPVKETSALLSSMEQYMEQLEQAKIASKMEQDKKVKTDKGKTDKQKKFEELMKKADELETQEKYREAWMKVPEVDQYPEHEAEIRARKSELSRKFSPDLFNEPKKD